MASVFEPASIGFYMNKFTNENITVIEELLSPANSRWPISIKHPRGTNVVINGYGASQMQGMKAGSDGDHDGV